MPEFGGLWKHQNNSACTDSVKSLQNVEAGHYTEERRPTDTDIRQALQDREPVGPSGKALGW